ncbi:MAG: 30S ribosomal protein S2 [Candidatus Gottesmanbacteria bacterium]
MEEISLKDLLEAGCHFGHQVPRWNPRASSFIYTSRDNIHIIDLVKTKSGLETAAEFIKSIASQGQRIIFVGTKRQAKAVVKEESKRVGANYLITRWLGGLLTNWDQIKKNIDKLASMKKEQSSGGWANFTKKEQLLKEREMTKLEGLYGGIADLTSIPSVLFLVDIRKEESAVREAIRTGVKTVAIVDTNANPDLIDYPIPGNDDATGSIKLICTYLADAYLEGKSVFAKATADKQEKNIEPEKKVETEEKKIEEKEQKETKETEPKKKVVKPARNASQSDAGGEKPVKKSDGRKTQKTRKSD